jgi:hypothetical protein
MGGGESHRGFLLFGLPGSQHGRRRGKAPASGAKPWLWAGLAGLGEPGRGARVWGKKGERGTGASPPNDR